MSISTNIDGSIGGANQLLDLLSVVSNPAVYESKLKALQDAIEQNKKYVELAGPASEILTIRDELKADQVESKALLDNAKDTANELTSKARAQATEAINAATEKATKIIDAAEAQQAEATAILSAAKADLVAAAKSKAAADELTATLDAKSKALDVAVAAANAAKTEAEKAKAEIIAKHKAFIESL